MLENFLIFLNIVPDSILILSASLLGSYIGSYISAKGKNLATREDIANITEKIEFVKHRFETLQLKSSALVERQLKAFDEISHELIELQIYCIRETQHSEHAVPFQELPQKSTFQRATYILEIAHRQRIYISKEVFEQLADLAKTVFMLGCAEMHVESVGEVSDKEYESVRLKAKKITSDLHDILFPKLD